MQQIQRRTYLSIHIKLHKIYNSAYHYGFRILVLAVSTVLLSFCKPKTSDIHPPDKDPFVYTLKDPDARYKLPDYLEEISGLSFIGNGQIACVQDEKAFIYVLNLEKEKIVEKYDFGKDADYEDIAVVDNTAWILRNDGDLFRVKDYRKKDLMVKKFETSLQDKNDTEGLAHDPLTSSLLVACKGSPSIDNDRPYEGYKAIYRFDLATEELIGEPQFLIDLESLDSHMDKSAFSRFSLRVAKRLHMIESETSFEPSGLAIHPLYGEIYVISSVGKLLIILDRRGNVKDVKELDPRIFRQPEGICFAPNGDMYISSEGQGGKGYILKFNIHATLE